MISMTFYIQLTNLRKLPQIFWKYVWYFTVIELKTLCHFFMVFWKYVRKYEKKSVLGFFFFFQKNHKPPTLTLWASYSFWSLCSLGREVTWLPNYAYFSLFLTLYFSTIICPNQACNFTFKFSLTLFHALSYTCLLFPYLLKITSVRYSKERSKKMHASGFQTFPKHSSQSSGAEEQIITPAEKCKEHNSTNKQEVYCSSEWRQRGVLPYLPVPCTLWEYSIKNNRAKMKRLICHKFCRWIT